MKTFAADRQVAGYVSCGVSAGVLLAGDAALVVGVLQDGSRGLAVAEVLVLVLVLAVTCPVIVVSLIVLFALPHMRYELYDKELDLVLGPWRSRISYDAIASVERHDLTFGPLSSFRMPGVAVFDVSYTNEGIVRMYSTHALKDVTILRTAEGRTYGISPADPEGFVAALAVARASWNPSSGTTPSQGAAPSVATQRAVVARWPLILGVCLALATLVMSVVFLPRLPAIIVTHWSLDGTPNGAMPRLPGVLGIPLAALTVAVLPLFLPRASRGPLALVTLPVQPVLFLTQLFLLLWNLGAAQRLGRLFTLGLLVLTGGSVLVMVVVGLRLQKPHHSSAQ